MLIRMLVLVEELGQFCWTMLTVLVLSHHYFRADIVEWEITTVVTTKTLAFDVETLEVRIIDEGLFPISMNSLDDWLIVTIKLIKVNNQVIENYLL